MGVEQKTVRVYADVMPGFDPNCMAWQNGLSVTTPMDGSRRIWLELTIPADHEIWPEKYEQGICLGRVGQRRIMVDDTARDSRAGQVTVRPEAEPAREERPLRRPMQANP